MTLTQDQLNRAGDALDTLHDLCREIDGGSDEFNNIAEAVHYLSQVVSTEEPE